MYKTCYILNFTLTMCVNFLLQMSRLIRIGNTYRPRTRSVALASSHYLRSILQISRWPSQHVPSSSRNLPLCHLQGRAHPRRGQGGIGSCTCTCRSSSRRGESVCILYAFTLKERKKYIAEKYRSRSALGLVHDWPRSGKHIYKMICKNL